MTHLLDSGVLIALCISDHDEHLSARSWLEANPYFAVCPTTEGALVRFLVRARPTGLAEARTILRSLERIAGYEFWPDDISYLSADLRKVSGHKQVTDAYLASLARAANGGLSTFDKSLVALYPEAVLVPSIRR